jgi:hypothetical protein
MRLIHLALLDDGCAGHATRRNSLLVEGAWSEEGWPPMSSSISRAISTMVSG